MRKVNILEISVQVKHLKYSGPVNISELISMRKHKRCVTILVQICSLDENAGKGHYKCELFLHDVYFMQTSRFESIRIYDLSILIEVLTTIISHNIFDYFISWYMYKHKTMSWICNVLFHKITIHRKTCHPIWTHYSDSQPTSLQCSYSFMPRVQRRYCKYKF